MEVLIEGSIKVGIYFLFASCLHVEGPLNPGRSHPKALSVVTSTKILFSHKVTLLSHIGIRFGHAFEWVGTFSMHYTALQKCPLSGEPLCFKLISTRQENFAQVYFL